MARIRTVKPEFFSSATVARCDPQARLLFIGIWNFADDEGRLLDIPRQILGNVFPHDLEITDRHVEGWLNQLEDQGLIARYVEDGKSVLSVIGWKDHQKISNPGKSHLPGIPEDYKRPSRDSTEDRRSSQGDSTDTLAPDLGPRTVGSSTSCSSNFDSETRPSVAPVENDGTAIAALERKELSGAIFEAVGYDPKVLLTGAEQTQLNVAAAELHKVGASLSDVRGRSLEFRRRWPEMTLTAMALVKHWSTLAPVVAVPSIPHKPCSECVDGWVEDPNVPNSVYRCGDCEGSGLAVTA